MSSERTARLDSWWIEKRWFNERITARIGQFAGQDFYGARHYAASFIFEPMGYGLSNLFNEAKGLDGTFAYDWSPPDVNCNYTILTAGPRFNEPLPLHFHNTMSLGYVRNSLSPKFVTASKAEQGVEFNALLDVLPMIPLQPMVQYYANVGGGPHRAVVFGFRTKVEF